MDQKYTNKHRNSKEPKQAKIGSPKYKKGRQPFLQFITDDT